MLASAPHILKLIEGMEARKNKGFRGSHMSAYKLTSAMPPLNPRPATGWPPHGTNCRAKASHTSARSSDQDGFAAPSKARSKTPAL